MKVTSSSLSDVAAEWRDARQVYSIYAAIIKSTDPGVGPCNVLETPVDRSDEGSLRTMREWLTLADEKTTAAHIRQIIQHSNLGTEAALRAMIHRYLARDSRTEEDRNKLDFLVVQYLAAKAPRSLVTGKVDLEDVAYVLESVFGEIPLTIPRVLEPLKALVERINACTSLRELIREGVVESGRKLKEQAGESYFGSSVLAAFARYNFLVRRAFVKLLHDDLESIRAGLRELEGRGVNAVDCTAAGFGQQESITDLRRYCHTWRNVFIADYGTGPSFRSIAEVRVAVEAAARAARKAPVKAQAPKAAAAVANTKQAAPSNSAASVAAVRSVSKEVAEIEDARARVNAAVQKAAPPAKVAFTLEQAIESIAKQLAIPAGSKPVSTATVKLGSSMVVLSAWELNAFVKNTDGMSQMLQRAVAARAVLIEALERGKRSGVKPDLAPVVDLANVVAAELHKKIGEAREKRSLDAAVNLAASSKRLGTVAAEAEKALGVTK